MFSSSYKCPYNFLSALGDWRKWNLFLLLVLAGISDFSKFTDKVYIYMSLTGV